MNRKITKALLEKAGLGAFFRFRDLRGLGITYYELQKSVSDGAVEKVSPGLYRLVSIAPTEMETIAMVASAIPSGIICLLSALRIHGIGTQNPSEVWIAIDRTARKPERLPTSIRFFRFSGGLLVDGVETRRMLGVPVKITSPARTVIDCFRYRNKVGLDVAIEALRESVRSRKVTINQLYKVAEACRMRTVMRSYLEAISG